MAKKKVAPKRVTVVVIERAVEELSAQNLIADGLEPKSGSDFSKYEKACWIADDRIKGKGGTAKRIRQHHRWQTDSTTRRALRAWRFVYEVQ